MNDEVKKFVPVTTVNVANQTVTRKHLTETQNSGEVECEWIFDFSEAKPEDILELASRSVLISRRGTFKKLKTDEIKRDQKMTINVGAYMAESSRKPVDKMAVAKKAIGSMTDEEKQALLAMLQGEVETGEAE